MLYDLGCKFNVKDSEISAILIHFQLTKLFSLLISASYNSKLWSDRSGHNFELNNECIVNWASQIMNLDLSDAKSF